MPSMEVGSSTYVCRRCGTAYGKPKGNFPVNYGPLYKGAGYLPYCKSCVDAIFNEYLAIARSDDEAMRQTCRKLDLYWNTKLFDAVKRTNVSRSMASAYIGKLMGARYAVKCYDDTLLEEGALWSFQGANQNSAPAPEGQADEAQNEAAEDPIPEEYAQTWGSGHTLAFYEDLERRYNNWVGDGECLEYNEQSLYRNICILEAVIARDAALGKPIDKSVNSLNTLLGSMNLKPAQRKEDTSAELENMPLGVGIQKWENYRPLPKSDLEDQSGIIKTVTTWLLGHICKMVNLKNSYNKAYETAMQELRVSRPEYKDEDDDTLLNDIFSSPSETHGGDDY